MFARSAVVIALLTLGGTALPAQQSLSATSRSVHASGGARGGALVQERQLRHQRATRSGKPHDYRRRAPHLAQHLADGGEHAPVPPLLQRLAKQPIDVDPRARPNRSKSREAA